MALIPSRTQVDKIAVFALSFTILLAPVLSARAQDDCSELLSFYEEFEPSVASRLRNNDDLTGDNRYLEFIDEAGVRRLALFDRYEFQDQRYGARVILPDGTRIELDPDRVIGLRASGESRAFWLGFDHEGHRLVGEKNLQEFEEGWRERILHPELRKGHSLANYPRVKVGREDAWLILPDTEGFMGRLADRLKKKFSLHLTVNPSEWTNASGAYWSNEEFVGVNGRGLKNQKGIDVSKEFFESGRLTEVELHEIGHAQTAARIENGVPDPLGVDFHAVGHSAVLPDGVDAGGKQMLPAGYSSYSSADEARQFAVTFHFILHQRRNRSVLRDFEAENGVLPAKKVYGVNLVNYFDALKQSERLLGFLRVFNFRNRKLAIEAREKLKLVHGRHDLFDGPDVRFEETGFPCRYRMSIRTRNVQVSVPIVDEVFEQYSPSGTWNPFLNQPFFNYATEYLTNLERAMDRQAALFDPIEKRILALRQNPDQPVTQQEYLELLDQVRALKSSVSADADHLGRLKP